MTFNKILMFLEDAIGLSYETVGENTIRRVVEARMKDHRLSTVDEYYKKLLLSESEKQEFINEVTVPETWFFRDHEPFSLLSDVVSKFFAERVDRRLRILSIPCSTGEEPYSISMVLLQLGLKKENYVIDAVDVSTKQLESAKKGIYTENSFRGKDISFREKYFEKVDDSYALSDEVKNSVVFHHQNVLSEKFMLGRGLYDVVFCRNLLIYFGLESKEKVMSTLHGLMTDGGVLFLGHAETGRMTQNCFEHLNHPGAFAYYKLKDCEIEVITGTEGRSFDAVEAPDYSDIARLPKVNKVVNCEVPKEAVASEIITDVEEDSLEVVQCLADRGQLSVALDRCQQYLETHPESAEGYCLRGVIELANETDISAVESFRKALYIDPNHYHALIHLSVLAEEQGNVIAAENYRARADRAAHASL